MQGILKLGGEGFQKYVRPQPQYRARSPPKDLKAHHASTQNLIKPNGPIDLRNVEYAHSCV